MSKTKKDTGKFWSFKDTTRHSNLKKISRLDITRFFTLKKSFLVKVLTEDEKSFEYIIPIAFTSTEWPRGSYAGISGNKKVNFCDESILEVFD